MTNRPQPFSSDIHKRNVSHEGKTGKNNTHALSALTTDRRTTFFLYLSGVGVRCVSRGCAAFKIATRENFRSISVVETLAFFACDVPHRCETLNENDSSHSSFYIGGLLLLDFFFITRLRLLFLHTYTYTQARLKPFFFIILAGCPSLRDTHPSRPTPWST